MVVVVVMGCGGWSVVDGFGGWGGGGALARGAWSVGGLDMSSSPQPRLILSAYICPPPLSLSFFLHYLSSTSLSTPLSRSLALCVYLPLAPPIATLHNPSTRRTGRTLLRCHKKTLCSSTESSTAPASLLYLLSKKQEAGAPVSGNMCLDSLPLFAFPFFRSPSPFRRRRGPCHARAPGPSARPEASFTLYGSSLCPIPRPDSYLIATLHSTLHTPYINNPAHGNHTRAAYNTLLLHSYITFVNKTPIFYHVSFFLACPLLHRHILDIHIFDQYTV